MLAMEQTQKLVDTGVKDWLSNQTQGAVSDSHSFFKPFSSNTRNTAHHFYLLVMSFLCTVEDHIWVIDFPSPRCTHRICSMPPAKDTLVAA